MSKTNRGRQNKSNDNIMNDINVEYLSTKTDTFEFSIVYFHLLDTQSK